MPRTKSAKKAQRKEKKRRARNLWHKERIKEVQLQIKKLIAQNKIKEAENLLPRLYKFVDKAKKAGVIKKNKASRLKSKFAKLILSKIQN